MDDHGSVSHDDRSRALATSDKRFNPTIPPDIIASFASGYNLVTLTKPLFVPVMLEPEKFLLHTPRTEIHMLSRKCLPRHQSGGSNLGCRLLLILSVGLVL